MAERNDRGQTAESPREIPKQGWMDIAKRTKAEAKTDHVPLLAGGVAFYGLLALFPALVALVSLWALVADPATLQSQVQDFLSAAPQEVRNLISSQLTSLSEGGALTFGLIAGIAVALWSASSGMKHLMEAINTAYDESESRGFLKVRGLALLLTLGALVFVVVMLGLIAAVPVWLEAVNLGGPATWAINLLRWPLMLAAFMGGLAVLYRYAPDRDEPKWSWASWGAVVAGVLFVLASVAFSIYVRNFGSYNETYGTFGAIIILMMWLLITALVVLLGAELNAEMEHQTMQDTTEGSEKPMGERDAFVADTAADADAGRTPAERRG